MPKVSVILPTYNRSLFLASAIQSALNQTFQDFEIVVVDDASVDSTRDTVRRFKDQRIKYIYHEMNKGEAASRNTGIINSVGEYIAFLDDDDEWFPEKLKLQIDLLEKGNGNVGCIYSGFLFVHRDDNKTLRQKIPTKKGIIFKDMLIKNVIDSPSSVVIRRQCLEKVGLFDEDLPYFVDYDLFLRISKYYCFAYIERPLLKYYVHDTQLSSDIDILEKGLNAIQKKYHKAYELGVSYNKIYSNHYLQIGILYCDRDNFAKGREALIKAIALNPMDYRIYFQLIFSLFSYRNYMKLRGMANRVVQALRRNKIAKHNQMYIS
jgi:glycosyltransferase involved in cell wall biosynthesis